MRTLRTAVALAALALLAGPLPAGEFDTPEALEKALTQTRRGPSGFFTTQAERQALRKRVKTEAWAKEHFQEKTLPNTERVRGLFKGDAMSLATAYIVTGDKGYAERVRDIAFYHLNWFDHIPHAEAWGAEAEGKKVRPKINYAWGMNLPMWIPQAYDLVCDALSEKDELRWRRGIVKQLLCCKNYYERFYHHNANQKACSLRQSVPWAASVRWEEMLDYLLHDKKERWPYGGVMEILDNYMRDGRTGVESTVYHYLVGTSLPPICETMRRYNGTDLYNYKTAKGFTIRGYLDGFIDQTHPMEQDGVGAGAFRIANWGSGSTTLSHHHTDIYLVNQGAMRIQSALWSLYRDTKDPKYGWFLSLLPEKERFPGPGGFLRGPLAFPADAPAPPAPCNYFPEAGFAMLRFPETPDYWTGGTSFFLHGGEKSRGHCADPFIMMHGKGRLLYPEWLPTQYENANKVGWNSRRVSKNTMVINGKDGAYSHSITRFSFDPEVKFISVRCTPYIQGEMERAVMFTGQYALDVFRGNVLDKPVPQERMQSMGGSRYWSYDADLATNSFHHAGMTIRNVKRKMPEEYTFDYMLHGIGRQFPDDPSLYKSSRDFSTSYWSYRWIQNERKRSTDTAFCVDWVQTSAGRRKAPPPRYQMDLVTPESWFEDSVGVRMRMLGGPGTTVYLGDGPMRLGPVDRELYPEEVLPLVGVRRTGKKQALFVALHEPFKTAAAILDFQYVTEPDLGEAHPVVGVKVTGPDYVDRLFVPLELPGITSKEQSFGQRRGLPGNLPLHTAASDADPGERVSFRSHLYIRHAGGKLVVRGPVESFSIYAPDVAAKRGLTVNGKPAAYSTRSGYVLFGNAQLSPDAAHKGLTIDAPVTDEPVIWPGRALPAHVTVRNVGSSRAGGEIVLTAVKDGAKLSAPVPVPELKPGQSKKLTLLMDFPEGARAGKPIRYAAVLTTKGGEARSTARDVTAGAPIAIRLPVKYVNLDAEKGGALLVDVMNTSDAPVEASLEVNCKKGLSGPPAQKLRIPAGKTERVQLALKAEANAAGKVLKVRVKLVLAAQPPYIADTVSTNVAVGMVLQEIDEQYTDRPSRHKSYKDVYDHFLIRSPGYTIQIDKRSGVSRWILDPEGHCRTSAGWYPTLKSRGGKYLHASGKPGGEEEFPRIVDARNKKLFGWNVPAKFVSRGTAEQGNPQLTFATEDDGYELKYTFTPEDVVAEIAKNKAELPGFRVDLKHVDIDEIGYKYQFVRKGNAFGFRPKAPVTEAPKGEWMKSKFRPADIPDEECSNVLANSDFTEMAANAKARGGQFPAGWQIDPAGSYKAVTVERADWARGGVALKVDLAALRNPAGKGIKGLSLVQRTVPVKAYHFYRVVMHLKYENVRDMPAATDVSQAMNRSTFNTSFRGKGFGYGIVLGRPPFLPHCWPNGTREPFTYRADILIGQPGTHWGPIPTDGNMWYINFNLYGFPKQSGTMWIDEVKLLEIPPSELAEGH